MKKRNRRDRSGKSFEQLVAEVFRRWFGKDILVRRNWRLEGASGVRYEIDLVIRIRCPENPDRVFWVAVECKDYARRVGKEKIEAFVSVLQDVNALRGKAEQLTGILVSRNGFQSGAVDLVRHRKMILLEIREPGEPDWKAYIWRLLGQDSGKHLFRTLDLSLRTEERVRIVPEQEPPWDVRVPLSRDPDSLMLEEKTLREILEEMPGKENAQRVMMRKTGEELHHMVLDGVLPVKEMEFSFLDLTREAKDAILFGPDRPDLVVLDPVYRRGFGIMEK